jgi:hypothetical protein
MFASVDTQQAYAEGSDGDHHSFDCKDQHSKCSQKAWNTIFASFPLVHASFHVSSGGKGGPHGQHPTSKSRAPISILEMRLTPGFGPLEIPEVPVTPEVWFVFVELLHPNADYLTN